MRVYCPNCGSENDGAPGSRVNCPACTASFDVPPEQDSPPPRPATPITPSPLGGFGGSSPAGRPAPSGPVAGSAGPLDPSRPFDASRPLALNGRKNNTLAIVSLVMGIICCIPFGSFIALGTGIAALKKIEASEGREGGKNLAVAGIVLGGLGVAVSVLGLIGAIFGK